MEINVIYQLDETKNQRIMFIRGQDDVETLNVIVSPNKEESYYHGMYLKEYFKKEYLDDIPMQKIRERIDGNFYMTRSIIYYLANKYNDIIFTEITGDNDPTKMGIFFVPEQITEKQYTKLKEILPYFEQFSMIFIQDELTAENIYDEKETQVLKEDEIAKLDDYFKDKLKTKSK